MRKRIVFVSIFDLTRLMHEVARGLEREGHQTFWIATDDLWIQWLVENGVSRPDIQRLIYSESDFLDEETKASVLSEILDSEAGCELTANQILLMDQFVAAKNKPNIHEYLYRYYHDIKRFLIEKQATHLVVEPTNTNELIAYMICRELDIKYVVPRPTRYPSRRLIFVDSYRDHVIYQRPDDDPDILGKTLIDDFTKKTPTPDYCEFQSQDNKLVLARSLLKSLGNRIVRGTVLSRNNLTHHNLSSRMSTTLKSLVNATYIRYFCHFTKLSDISGRVAYFPIHVQPESSIDVMGSYFSEQLKLIKDIRRALPFDTTLVVKEHPDLFWVNPMRLLRAIQRIPGVAMIKYDVPLPELLRRADLVLTVSGTTAYEAGLLGVPAITFCPMFFSGLSSVATCTNIVELKGLIHQLLSGFERDYEADCAFMEKMMKNSYRAMWDSPVRSPEVLGPDNVGNLTDAFLKLLSVGSREPQSV